MCDSPGHSNLGCYCYNVSRSRHFGKEMKPSMTHSTVRSASSDTLESFSAPRRESSGMAAERANSSRRPAEYFLVCLDGARCIDWVHCDGSALLSSLQATDSSWAQRSKLISFTVIAATIVQSLRAGPHHRIHNAGRMGLQHQRLRHGDRPGSVAEPRSGRDVLPADASLPARIRLPNRGRRLGSVEPSRRERAVRSLSNFR